MKKILLFLSVALFVAAITTAPLVYAIPMPAMLLVGAATIAGLAVSVVIAAKRHWLHLARGPAILLAGLVGLTALIIVSIFAAWSKVVPAVIAGFALTTIAFYNITTGRRVSSDIANDTTYYVKQHALSRPRRLGSAPMHALT